MEHLLRASVSTDRLQNTLDVFGKWFDDLDEETQSRSPVKRSNLVIKTLIHCISQGGINFLFLMKDGAETRAVATSYFVPLLNETRTTSKINAAIPTQFRTHRGVMGNLWRDFEFASKHGWPKNISTSSPQRRLKRVKTYLEDIHRETGIEYCMIYELGCKRRTVLSFGSNWLDSVTQEKDVVYALNQQECKETWDKVLVVSGKRRASYTRPTITLPQPNLRGKRQIEWISENTTDTRETEAASSCSMTDDHDDSEFTSSDDEEEEDLEEFVNQVNQTMIQNRRPRKRQK